MTKPTTLKWSRLTLWPGNGASPEVFASKSCGLTTQGISFTAQTSDAIVADCDDPDSATWTERVARALSAGISGAGVMAEETFAFWRDWQLSTLAKNVRVILDGVTLNGYFEGAFALTSFEVSANEGDGKIRVTLRLDSDGPVSWIDLIGDVPGGDDWILDGGFWHDVGEWQDDDIWED